MYVYPFCFAGLSTLVSLVYLTFFSLAWCAAVDFYFALLPWIFIWKLNMKFKEKMSIAISLSLGFMYVVQFCASLP
jgi:hypothetical protein